MSFTQEYLRDVLGYDPASGVFTWRRSIGPRALVGAVAGSINRNGYLYISIDRKLYLAQRLAWFYMTGMWPLRVDHKDRCKTNNAWLNLREATRSENGHNRAGRTKDTPK